MQQKEVLLLPADPQKGRPLNVEYHIQTGWGAPLEVSAFQIDLQNPEKFKVLNSNGTHPVLIHANIVGYLADVFGLENTYLFSAVLGAMGIPFIFLLPGTPKTIIRRLNI